MDAWAFDDPQNDERVSAVVKYLKKQTKDKTLSENTGRLWGLYLFLTSRPFSSADEIRSSVFLDHKHTQPVFTQQEAEQLFELLNNKEGGAIVASQEEVEVLDNLIMKWLYFVRDWSPAFVVDTTDALSPYIFILKGLEENEEFGPLVGIALDATEAGLKSMAATIQNMMPFIIGLLPLPEAGPAGEILAWLVSSVFVVLMVAIHLSRRQFGQSFIVSFGLIPIVGESLYNAAMSGERFLQKTSQKRGRLLDSTRKILGDGVADTLDSVIPDPLSPAIATNYDSAPAPAPVDNTEGELALQKELASYKPIQGGKTKRFSKKLRKNGKWRTQRNKFVK
jgi:hypothetical protein